MPDDSPPLERRRLAAAVRGRVAPCLAALETEMKPPMLSETGDRFADAINHGGKALTAAAQTVLLLCASAAWIVEHALISASAWLDVSSEGSAQ